MSRRKDERGSISVFVGVSSVLLVVLGSFAVDLGMQRVVRRDMQALADVVALDLARELDGRTKSELAGVVDPADPTSTLSLSVARNGDTLGDPPTVTAQLGGLVGDTFDASVDPPTAVRVTAVGSVDFAFSSGSGSATRSAIGATIKSACYSLGSFAARFRSGDAALISLLVEPMNELLRPQADLDAASYSGLATATVTLDELAAAAGAGSTEQFLAATITVEELIALAIDVLQAGAPVNSVAVEALGDVLDGQALLDTPVLLTEVVNVAPTDTAALQVDLNLLDVVTGAVLLADGEHGFQLGNGNLGAGIAGAASLSQAELSVIERPSIACGPFGSAESTAATSQVSGTAHVKLELPTINLGGGDIVQTAPAAVVLSVDMGNSTGALAGEPVCGEGTAVDPDSLQVAVQSGLATYSLRTTLGFRTTLNIAGVGNVEVTWSQLASAGGTTASEQTTADLFVPPHDTTPVATGNGDPGLVDVVVSATPSDVNATVRVGGVPTPVPAATVLPTLTPIAATLATHATVDGELDAVAEAVDGHLTPLFTLLGLNVVGADVLAVGRPVCGAPVLRG